MDGSITVARLFPAVHYGHRREVGLQRRNKPVLLQTSLTTRSCTPRYPAFGSVGCSRDGVSPLSRPWIWPAFPSGMRLADGAFRPQPHTPRQKFVGIRRAIEGRSRCENLSLVGLRGGRFVSCSVALCTFLTRLAQFPHDFDYTPKPVRTLLRSSQLNRHLASIERLMTATQTDSIAPIEAARRRSGGNGSVPLRRPLGLRGHTPRALTRSENSRQNLSSTRSGRYFCPRHPRTSR